MEHLLRLGNRLVLGRVGGVALLPEELGGAEEEARAHFPAHHVGPLVHQQRQVAVALDPVLVGLPDDGLRRRADDELLLELGVRVHDHALAVGIVLEAVVGHHRTLLGEAFHVGRLLAQVAFRDEQREVRIDMAGVLEHAVQHVLHALPDGKAVGLDDHAALDVAVLGEVGLDDNLIVPLGIVLVAGGQFGHGKNWYGVCSVNDVEPRKYTTANGRAAAPTPCTSVQSP